MPIPQTQSIAMNLITAIVTENERGIEEFTTPNIVLTTVHNGGQPVVKHGREEYLATIRLLWKGMLEYKHSDFVYEDFNAVKGKLQFIQVCLVQCEKGPQYMLSEGTQSFTFEKKITAIEVVETDTILTSDAYEQLIATIAEQKKKIATNMTSNIAVSSYMKSCTIL